MPPTVKERVAELEKRKTTPKFPPQYTPREPASPVQSIPNSVLNAGISGTTSEGSDSELLSKIVNRQNTGGSTAPRTIPPVPQKPLPAVPQKSSSQIPPVPKKPLPPVPTKPLPPTPVQSAAPQKQSFWGKVKGLARAVWNKTADFMLDAGKGDTKADRTSEDYDAAAEKKGFWGGLGRRALSPVKFIGRALMGLKGPSMDTNAKLMAAKQLTDTERGDLGDAEAYSDPVEISGSDKNFYDSPLPTLVPTIASTVADTGVNTVGDMVKPESGKFGGLTDIAEGKMKFGAGSIAGMVGGGLSAIGSALGFVKNMGKAGTSSGGGNKAAAAQSKLSAAEDLVSFAGSGAKALGYAGVGAGEVAKHVLPGLSVATGVSQTARGTISAVSGKRAEKKMTEQISKLSADKAANSMGFSDKQRLSLMRTMHMAREMGAINKEAGAGEAVAGALNTAGGVATLTGAGAPIGTALSAAGMGLSTLSGFNKSVQVEDMRSRIVDQELGMTERLADLDKELGDKAGKYDRRTKEKIILQRLGYNSGTRKEAFMNIAMNRSKMMTGMANADKVATTQVKDVDDPAKAQEAKEALRAQGIRGADKYDWSKFDNPEEAKQAYLQRKFARQTVKGMGVSEIDAGNGKKAFSQQGIAEKLGMDEGIDIRHQLAASREGESAQEALTGERLKMYDTMAEQKSKADNAWFSFTRARHQKKFDKASEKLSQLGGITPDMLEKTQSDITEQQKKHESAWRGPSKWFKERKLNKLYGRKFDLERGKYT